MSIQAVAFVLDTEVKEVAAKMLMVSLANAHNHTTGLCCPSVARLSFESGMSRRSVQRWLKWLDDQGLIEIIEKTDASGRQQANEYKIVGFSRGATVTPSHKPKAIPVTPEGVTGDAPEGVTGDAPLKEPEEYRKKERERERVTFDEVWEVFPKRPNPNRKEAQREFDQLSEDETPRLLTAATRFARWHIEDAQARGETPESQLQFRPGLGKWIRTGAWVEALHLTLKADPVPASVEGMVYLPADHPDFQAVERMLGRKLPIVSASGKRAFRIEEIEQARAAS